MSNKDHPLNDEFDIEGSAWDDEFDEGVDIPDNREQQNLELVIELALKQYKQNIDDMALVEPKNRIKLQEINRDLLNTAKDAKYKLETIKINQAKLDVLRNKKTGAPVDSTASGEGEGEGEEDQTFSRSSLAKLRSVK